MTVSSEMFRDDLMGAQAGVTLLFGNFTMNADPAIASQDCYGFSVARTAEGLFTITLDQIYAGLITVCAMSNEAAGDLGAFNVTAETVASTKTISLVCLGSAGAAHDPADTKSVYLTIVVRHGSTI